MALNAKQQRFAEEYVRDFNATQAAIRAGYSKKTAGALGFRLLKNVEISDAIRQIQIERRNAAIMEYDEACEILSNIARGTIGDYMDDDGRIDIRRIREVRPSAVQSIEHDMKIEGTNAEPEYIHITKFKLHSPIQAIQQLAKMKSWNAPEDHNVTVHQTLADMLAASGMEDDDTAPDSA